MNKKIQCTSDFQDHASEIREITDELRKAQTKHTIARLYEKILDYGSELILREPKCVVLENRDTFKEDPLIVGEPSRVIDSQLHDHKETLKRNAQFLIESSRKLPDYSPVLLLSMENAFHRSDYEAVIDYAMQHDTNTRQQRTNFDRESDQDKTKEQIQSEVDEINNSLLFSHNWATLLDEILAEKPLEKTALGHCISAIKALSGELTYDARAMARKSLARAIVMLEEAS